MRPGHGGTISRLCACRRDRRDIRRRHRQRARHRGGAALGLVARRATEWHEFAVLAWRAWIVAQFLGIPGLHGARRPIIPLTRHGRRRCGGPFRSLRVHRRPRPAPERRATREPVPPVLHAVELPISRKRSDHRGAVEALVSGPAGAQSVPPSAPCRGQRARSPSSATNPVTGTT